MIQGEIIGAEDLIKGFEKFGKDAGKAIKKAVDKSAVNVETLAKKRLSGQFGSRKHIITNRLRADVHKQLSKSGDLAMLEDMESAVGTNVKYAAYIEFGTGDYVDILPGWEEVAAKFKGKRKVKGFKGDSFLGWALLQEKKQLPERITKELNKLINEQ